jgi:hypothetical protein
LNLHFNPQERMITADSLLRYQSTPKMFPDWRAGRGLPGQALAILDRPCSCSNPLIESAALNRR